MSFLRRKSLWTDLLSSNDDDDDDDDDEGYVLGADWKTQFTIKAFKGLRRVKDTVKQVAVEYSNGDIQWIDKDILKFGEAQDS